MEGTINVVFTVKEARELNRLLNVELGDPLAGISKKLIEAVNEKIEACLVLQSKKRKT